MNRTSLQDNKTHHAQLAAIKQSNPAVIPAQENLTVEQVVQVARYGTQACISSEQEVLQREVWQIWLFPLNLLLYYKEICPRDRLLV